MGFRFAARQAQLVDVAEIFALLTQKKNYNGTLENLVAEISGVTGSTYWIAVREGELFATVRATALGPGFARFIALDQIVLAERILAGELDVAPLEVLQVLFDRALGDLPAYAVVAQQEDEPVSDEMKVPQSTLLAIVSKALLTSGFAPVAAAELAEREKLLKIFNGQENSDKFLQVFIR